MFTCKVVDRHWGGSRGNDQQQWNALPKVLGDDGNIEKLGLEKEEGLTMFSNKVYDEVIGRKWYKFIYLMQVYAYNDESSCYACKIDNKMSLNIILVPWCTFIFSAICFSNRHFFSFIISSLAYSWRPEFSTPENLKLLLPKLLHLKMYSTYCLYFYSCPKSLYFFSFM